jgi:cytidine deaminase
MSTKKGAGDTEHLIHHAREASKHSYSPYSHIRVGASLYCSDGTIFQGANVENRSYGLTICAERSAIFSAVSAGRRSFLKIAIYSPDTDYAISPCGACRQVMSEFGDAQFKVIMAFDGGFEERPLSELFPMDSLHELKSEQ